MVTSRPGINKDKSNHELRARVRRFRLCYLHEVVHYSTGLKHALDKEREMSRVRVLVGTRKGAFILTADGKRDKWDVSGPHFAGWEIYHLKGSPADPDRIFVSQTSGWFGQVIQRSDDGGKTWHQPGTPPGEPG